MAKSNNQKDILEHVEHFAENIHSRAQKTGKSVFRKYPLSFSFFSIFGFMSVLYGFEQFFDSISFFRNNPILVLIMGIVILMGTGTLYSWLQNKDINAK